MSRIGLVLVRLCVVLAGYACAALAASAVLHIALFAVAGFGITEAPWVAAGSVVVSVPFVALFVAYVAFVPAAVAIGVAEVAGWRSRTIHALAGGAVAIVALPAFWSARLGDLADGPGAPLGAASGVSEPLLAAALLAAGIGGGLAHWLVAGRTAGGWRRGRRP